ncbi:MAG TPA: autotransporter outer membrane beta-barrel domain-containing protein [Candidatus Aphodousia faecigallinarum]|uniref:Autotransporter outer membrane beta-barrel domain-containing protein n=1 Tax=Candidatus Aphodousia faecigallinarum TaxID=2840677 RepID=A0A9D1IH46_9BURK|nr:autotransporter outer membrane beta-barrel domain-containing protein [Candidatus Aphodousia faecigallinarum]
MKTSFSAYRKNLICIAVSAAVSAFSTVAYSEVITDSRDFTNDTVIEEMNHSCWYIVNAGEGPAIELTSSNGSDLTLKSDWSAHVGAHDGGQIVFKGLDNLTIETGMHGLSAQDDSSITVDISGKLTLNSSGAYTDTKGTGILTGVNATNSTMAGGDVDINASRAINNSGTTSLTGASLYLTGTGDAAVLNMSGETSLNSGNIVEISNSGNEEKSYGIWSQSGNVQIQGQDITVRSKNDTGVLFSNAGSVQFGDEDKSAGTVTISGKNYGVNSYGSGEEAGKLNIYAEKVNISSDAGNAVDLDFGTLTVQSDALTLEANANDAIALEVARTASVDVTAAEDITVNSYKGIRNSGNVTLASQGSLSINATGDYGLETSKGIVELSAGSNEGDILSIKATGDGSNGIFASSENGSSAVSLSGATVIVEGDYTGISAQGSSVLQFGTEGTEIGTLNITGGTNAIYYNSSAEANMQASNFFANSTSGYSIYAVKGTLNLTTANATIESADNIGLNTVAGAKTNIFASDKVTVKAGSQAVRTFGELNIQGKTEGSSLANLEIISDSGNGIASCAEGAQVTINAVNSNFISNEDATSEGKYSGNAVSASVGGRLTFVDTGSAMQKISIDSRWGSLFSRDTGSSIVVESGAVDLTGSVLAVDQASIELGSKKALSSADIRVEPGNTGADLAAINARNGSVTLNAVDATITSSDYAVLATGSSEDSADSTVNIETTGSLVISGDIVANIERNGATTPEAGAGDRTVYINQKEESTGTINITGDVSTVSDADTTSIVRIGLKTADSTLTGSITDIFVGEDSSQYKGGTTLGLENGASWNVTGDSSIQNVTANDGTILTNGHQVAVNTLVNDGEGTQFVTNSAQANQIRIREVEGEGLGIHLTDEATNELDANNPQEALAAIASIENADSGYSITSDEAGVLGDMQLVMDKDGNVVSFTEKANTVNEGLQDIAASNYLFFRSSMNDVNKRMGDLRAMPKTSGGAWARYYGGEMKYGDMNMETTYNTLQVGADGWIDNIYLGASVSISDGDGDLDNGSVDNRNYNFGVYGGWVSDNGQFVDVIVKRHRMETDGQLRSTAGTKNKFDFYNWGTSVSVEYGWRFNCPSTNFWVEHQAELMYGRLDSVNFRTSQGAQVSQDAVDSLIGRLGASVGYTFDQNRGSAYFKASVLHDWKGETDSNVTANGATRSFHDDLGGTWGEFALGGTYNITNTFSAYGDVMTTTGSPVRNPWQISVGVRYSF